LKYSVLIFVEKKYIKCNIWRVAVRPSYIQDARFLKVKKKIQSVLFREIFAVEFNVSVDRMQYYYCNLNSYVSMIIYGTVIRDVSVHQ